MQNMHSRNWITVIRASSRRWRALGLCALPPDQTPYKTSAWRQRPAPTLHPSTRESPVSVHRQSRPLAESLWYMRMHMYTYICVCIYVYACMHACTCVRIWARVRVRMDVPCLRAHIYAAECISTSLHQHTIQLRASLHGKHARTHVNNKTNASICLLMHTYTRTRPYSRKRTLR